jgi:hypothetical protein
MIPVSGGIGRHADIDRLIGRSAQRGKRLGLLEEPGIHAGSDRQRAFGTKTRGHEPSSQPIDLRHGAASWEVRKRMSAAALKRSKSTKLLIWVL